MVDDEREILDLGAEYLERAGYEVDKAENGQLAIAKIEIREYQVIILDLRMPGMDGFEVCSWISRRFPELVSRVLILTGDTANPRVRDFLSQMRYRYLTKPVDLETLARTVNDMLIAQGQHEH